MSAKRFLHFIFTATLTLLSSFTAASSFLILEQSPAHLGTAFSGTASNIGDASTVFFNPAGMSWLDESTASVGGNLILVQSQFHDNGSTTGGSTSETDEPGLVPNVYFVQPMSAGWTFGFGLNAPFGLASSYSDNWIGRYLATESELEVVNLNATFAYQFNERFSLGAGLNYQRVDVTLKSQIDSTLGVNPDPVSDSSATIRGDDDAVVLDLSAHFRPVDGTALGLTWRQGGDFSLSGDAVFEPNTLCTPNAGFPTGAPPAPTTGTLCAGALAALAGDVLADVELPDTLTLSASQAITDQWSVHGDIAWTRWSSINSIEIENTSNNAIVDTLDLRYDDTMRYALGTSYRTHGPWTLRAGIAVDEAPQTDPVFVSPRIPDQDRIWLSAGVNYEISDTISVDAGYAHLFVDDSHIDNLDPQTGHHVIGSFDANVDIVGVQANWRF